MGSELNPFIQFLALMPQAKKSELDMFIINKVKEFRLKHKMSQAVLATKLELPNSFIGKVESPNSITKYNLHHLNNIAKIFNCSPRDFLPENPI